MAVLASPDVEVRGRPLLKDFSVLVALPANHFGRGPWLAIALAKAARAKADQSHARPQARTLQSISHHHLLARQTRERTAEWMTLRRRRITLRLKPYKAACLEFCEMSRQGSRRDMRGRLEFSKRSRATFQCAKHFYPARMGESRGQFEKRFDRLCFSTQHKSQCSQDLTRRTFGRVGGRPVFHPAANPPTSQQPAGFQRAQVLTRSWQRQSHLPGYGGDCLVWLPNQQREYLQALAVSQGTGGTPKRRPARR